MEQQPDQPVSASFSYDKKTISLPSTVWDAMEARARKDQTTFTEAVRRSCWLYLFFMDRLERGQQIILEHPDGVVSERVIFPYV